MNLDEAIQHCKEQAETLRMTGDSGCTECATEHEQLAEWLTELKQRREAEIREKTKTIEANIDRDEILRLCESLETDITALRMTERIEYDFYSAMIDSVQGITAEITTPPKTNGDRIRQMTDEELADKLTDKCTVCAFHNAECETTFCLCMKGVLKWLKQEAIGND